MKNIMEEVGWDTIGMIEVKRKDIIIIRGTKSYSKSSMHNQVE